MIDKNKGNAVQIEISNLLESIYNERIKIAKSNSLVTREQAHEELKKIEEIAGLTRVRRRHICAKVGIDRARICTILKNGHGGKYPLTANAIQQVSNAYLEELKKVQDALNAIKNANTNE